MLIESAIHRIKRVTALGSQSADERIDDQRNRDNNIDAKHDQHDSRGKAKLAAAELRFIVHRSASAAASAEK